MLGLLTERGGGENGIELKVPDPLPNLPQVKLVSSYQQAKYDTAMSLKAAAESAPSYLTITKAPIRVRICLCLSAFLLYAYSNVRLTRLEALHYHSWAFFVRLLSGKSTAKLSVLL